MDSGGLGWAMMGTVAFIVGALGFVPLLIVGLIPVLRRSLVAWSVAFGLCAATEIALSVQIRVVTGPDGTADPVFDLGLLLALAPILLLGIPALAARRRHWPLAFIPLALVAPWGFEKMAFRHRSERLPLAASQGDAAEIARLLREGADPNCFEIGHCAVDLAVERRDWRIVEALVESGAVSEEYYLSPGMNPNSPKPIPLEEQTDEEKFGGPRTSAAQRLDALGRHDLARRLRANSDRCTP